MSIVDMCAWCYSGCSRTSCSLKQRGAPSMTLPCRFWATSGRRGSSGLTQRRSRQWLDWPQPTSRKNLLGFANFYRWYKYHLTSTSLPFLWSEEAASAFQSIKACLTSAPVVCHPASPGSLWWRSVPLIQELGQTSGSTPAHSSPAASPPQSEIMMWEMESY